MKFNNLDDSGIKTCNYFRDAFIEQQDVKKGGRLLTNELHGINSKGEWNSKGVKFQMPKFLNKLPQYIKSKNKVIFLYHSNAFKENFGFT